VRVGGHSHSINDQAAALVLFVGAHAGVFAVTGPSSILRVADQTSTHRDEVYVVDLFVAFLDRAQGAVEEPGLPQFAVRAPALFDRTHRALLQPPQGQRKCYRVHRGANAVPVVGEKGPSGEVKRGAVPALG
jgi:hypothetical protein